MSRVGRGRGTGTPTSVPESAPPQLERTQSAPALLTTQPPSATTPSAIPAQQTPSATTPSAIPAQQTPSVATTPQPLERTQSQVLLTPSATPTQQTPAQQTSSVASATELVESGAEIAEASQGFLGRATEFVGNHYGKIALGTAAAGAVTYGLVGSSIGGGTPPPPTGSEPIPTSQPTETQSPTGTITGEPLNYPPNDGMASSIQEYNKALLTGNNPEQLKYLPNGQVVQGNSIPTSQEENLKSAMTIANEMRATREGMVEESMKEHNKQPTTSIGSLGLPQSTILGQSSQTKIPEGLVKMSIPE